MNRGDFLQRLGSLDGRDLSGDEASDFLLQLAREIRDYKRAKANQGTGFKAEAAAAFVEILWGSQERDLRAEFSGTLVDRIQESILAGPAAISALVIALQQEVASAVAPQERLELLRRRHHCLQLRQKCLEHLKTIFDAERIQP